MDTGQGHVYRTAVSVSDVYIYIHVHLCWALIVHNKGSILVCEDKCCTAVCVCVTHGSCVLQQVRTGDLGGYASSDEFTQAVIANLAV